MSKSRMNVGLHPVKTDQETKIIYLEEEAYLGVIVSLILTSTTIMFSMFKITQKVESFKKCNKWANT